MSTRLLHESVQSHVFDHCRSTSHTLWAGNDRVSLRRQEAVPLHLSIFICILKLRTYKNPATLLLMHTGGVFSFQGILQCHQQCHMRHIQTKPSCAGWAVRLSIPKTVGPSPHINSLETIYMFYMWIPVYIDRYMGLHVAEKSIL